MKPKEIDTVYVIPDSETQPKAGKVGQQPNLARKDNFPKLRQIFNG